MKYVIVKCWNITTFYQQYASFDAVTEEAALELAEEYDWDKCDIVVNEGRHPLEMQDEAVYEVVED